MATITTATTVESRVESGTRRFLFRYVLSNGETHERRAWVPDGTDDATERDARGAAMLVEQADAEAALLLGAD
jgi:hypothetical protein